MKPMYLTGVGFGLRFLLFVVNSRFTWLILAIETVVFTRLVIIHRPKNEQLVCMDILLLLLCIRVRKTQTNVRMSFVVSLI